MIERLNSKSFYEHLNSEFKVLVPNEQPVSLRLAEVAERDGGPRVEQFSLFFRGPKTPLLEQRIYHLQHETLGQLDLFLVPISIDEQGLLYECVFNRFRKPETPKS